MQEYILVGGGGDKELSRLLLDDQRHIGRADARNGMLEGFITDVLDKEIGYDQLCMRQPFCFLGNIAGQGDEDVRQPKVADARQLQVIGVDFHTVECEGYAWVGMLVCAS